MLDAVPSRPEHARITDHVRRALVQQAHWRVTLAGMLEIHDASVDSVRAGIIDFLAFQELPTERPTSLYDKCLTSLSCLLPYCIVHISLSLSLSLSLFLINYQ